MATFSGIELDFEAAQTELPRINLAWGVVGKDFPLSTWSSSRTACGSSLVIIDEACCRVHQRIHDPIKEMGSVAIGPRDMDCNLIREPRMGVNVKTDLAKVRSPHVDFLIILPFDCFFFFLVLTSYCLHSELHRGQPILSTELSLKHYSSFIDRMASPSYLYTRTSCGDVKTTLKARKLHAVR